MNRPLGRRDFLRTTAAIIASAVTGSYLVAADAKKPKLKKAVKYGMVKVPNGTHLQRLELAKKCGFVGVEIDSPGTDKLDELVKASKETGVAIHGVIDSVHWKDTLSSPDEKIRAKGLAAARRRGSATRRPSARTPCYSCPEWSTKTRPTNSAGTARARRC